MGYAELLKDPRWQKRRLEIMERDEWTCQTCKDTKATLTVHHKSYRMVGGKFVDIWDYPGDDLITLCEACHAEEEQWLDFHKKNMYFATREYCENSDAMYSVVRLFKDLRNRTKRRVTVDDVSKIKDFVKRNIHPEFVVREGESMSDMLAKMIKDRD